MRRRIKAVGMRPEFDRNRMLYNPQLISLGSSLLQRFFSNLLINAEENASTYLTTVMVRLALVSTSMSLVID